VHDALSRRTLLEWMGRATVIGLASPLIHACEQASGGAIADVPGAAPGPDPGREPGADHAGDGAAEAGADPGAEASGACEFQPGTGDLPIYQGWGERTVDPVDLASVLATWRLEVGGMVDRPLSLSFCDLRDLGLTRQVTDFHCVEGWSVLDVPWDGIPLARLIDLAGPRFGATWVTFRTVGGKYLESLVYPVAREPRTLLGLGVDGHTLPVAHGFPCRVVVPRLYGYKNAKYVTRIDLESEEQVGFWPKFGYTTSGEVDPSRLREGKY